MYLCDIIPLGGLGMEAIFGPLRRVGLGLPDGTDVVIVSVELQVSGELILGLN